MNSIERAKVVVMGLSLDLYHDTFDHYIEKQEDQLKRFTGGLEASVEILSRKVCYLPEHVEKEILLARNRHADALLIVPMCYTASLMSVPALLECNIPLIVFNTQELKEIREDFDFDDLIMNHVIQGTQDVTNILIRGGRIFGMESGHYQDKSTLRNLFDWLEASRTVQRTRKSRVGLLGSPAQDMGDFGVDETLMRTKWGPHTVYLSLGRFAELLDHVAEEQINEVIRLDRERFDLDEKLSQDTHGESVRLELAFRQLVAEKNLDAFSMNFSDIVSDGRFPTIPFFGINKMISEGYGYAGEGNTLIAALMSQMRQLCGAANFTETFTVDFKRNTILMCHMQECNPALARTDRKIKLVHKDFWAKGIGPYTGMHFSLEPGPVTLITMYPMPDYSFKYICYETEIDDSEPMPRFDIPHWLIHLDEDAGDFLTRYSMAGGSHHLVSVPGHCSEKIRKLAFLQHFDCTIL